jgi:hypothetical protein
VDENTDEDDASGELFQYFHGEDNVNTDFLVSFQKDPVRLWEVGDREIMQTLVEQGLIRVPFDGEYNFAVTPLGHTLALLCLGNLANLQEKVRSPRGKAPQSG